MYSTPQNYHQSHICNLKSKERQENASWYFLHNRTHKRIFAFHSVSDSAKSLFISEGKESSQFTKVERMSKHKSPNKKSFPNHTHSPRPSRPHSARTPFLCKCSTETHTWNLRSTEIGQQWKKSTLQRDNITERHWDRKQYETQIVRHQPISVRASNHHNTVNNNNESHPENTPAPQLTMSRSNQTTRSDTISNASRHSSITLDTRPHTTWHGIGTRRNKWSSVHSSLRHYNKHCTADSFCKTEQTISTIHHS